MAQSSRIKVTGMVAASPATSSAYSCTLQALMDLSLCAVYQAAKGAELSIASTDLAPYSVPFESITKGRFFCARVLSGASMKLLITTGLGVATLPLSDRYMIHNPSDGDEITAIQIVGTGDLAYVLSGDVL